MNRFLGSKLSGIDRGIKLGINRGIKLELTRIAELREPPELSSGPALLSLRKALRIAVNARRQEVLTVAIHARRHSVHMRVDRVSKLAYKTLDIYKQAWYTLGMNMKHINMKHINMKQGMRQNIEQADHV